jgi:Xaa-Pro aminopeptidase
MSSRRDSLTQLMEERDLDAMALCAAENVAFFARTHLITQTIVPDRLAFLIATRDGGSALLVSDIEEAVARRQSSIDDLRVYVEFIEQPARTAAEIIRSFGVERGRIGVDARRMSYATAEALQAALSSTTLHSVDDELEAIQMIKNAEMVDELTAAARATQRAVETAVAACTPGASERDITSRIAGEIARSGGILYFLVFGSGQGSLVSHLEADSRVMEEGEIFRIDVGARFPTGFLSDLGRCGVIGEPSPVQTETLHALRGCQQAVFDVIEPGRPVKDLYAACKQAFAHSQLPFTMPHVGHGLGVALHEKPRLHPNNETRLAAGMVLNVEPLALLAERGEGYFTEDLVLVTDDGHRVLTSPQEELLVLGGPR